MIKKNIIKKILKDIKKIIIINKNIKLINKFIKINKIINKNYIKIKNKKILII